MSNGRNGKIDNLRVLLALANLSRADIVERGGPSHEAQAKVWDGIPPNVTIDTLERIIRRVPGARLRVYFEFDPEAPESGEGDMLPAVT